MTEGTLKRFAGKSAIVTGAGQGIGFEICRLLAAQGADVLLNDSDAVLAAEAAKKIQSANGNCLAFAGDVSGKALIDQMVKAAVDKFGKIDIVIANAGITLFGDFFTYPPESFYKLLEVNLGGSFFLTQAAANQMKNQGKGGTILLTSSVTAHQAHQHLAAYSMSKAALEMLARNLVIDLSPFNITINCIAPGATNTERTITDADYIKTWSTITPLGHPATVSDIAHAALFLVSPEAKHITGQTLVIDGGWTAVSPKPYHN